MLSTQVIMFVTQRQTSQIEQNRVDGSLGGKQPWEQRLLSSFLAHMERTLKLAFSSKHRASLPEDLW